MSLLRAANSMLHGIAAGSASHRTALLAVRHLSRAATFATPILQHAVATGITASTSTSTSTSSNWPCRAPQSRLFSHTPACQRKNPRKIKKPQPNNDDAEGGASSSSSHANNKGSGAGEGDPFDFSDLQAAFDRAEQRFGEELKQLRAGGRSAAEAIGAIPVQMTTTTTTAADRGRAGKEAATFPLRELAAVAPLGGRRWSILAFEEASVKAIVAAVQRADGFGGQQPQRSADNPLELTVTVEPERADALARRARDVCQAWRDRVRNDTHRRAELLKKARASRLVLSDDLHRLREKLQKLQDERMKTIQAREKEVVAAILARG
ncbi:hypothetical protein VTH06DRAFT_8143 [Thermothelomyces fergusii]